MGPLLSEPAANSKQLEWMKAWRMLHFPVCMGMVQAMLTARMVTCDGAIATRACSQSLQQMSRTFVNWTP